MMRPLVKSAALVLFALIAGSRFVERDRLYVNGVQRILNDQVGYISVGRNLAERGRMDSDVVYPSTLAQRFSRNSLYMPGHYWALAAVFKAAGYSVWNSFLPSLCGYAASALLLFFIAGRAYGESAGYLAASLFLFFPLNLTFAFTAMAEMDLMAAVLGAFALFLALPARLRPWCGPLLLVPALLFRETSAALAAPMAALVFFESKADRRKTAAFAVLSCAVVGLVMASPAAAGRPSLWAANILFRGGQAEVYTDAFAVLNARPAAVDWAAAIARNILANLRSLLSSPHFGVNKTHPAEYIQFLFILSGIPLGAFRWRRRQDAFALGVGAMVLLLLVLDLAFYVVWSFRGVKSLLICQPFVAALWAASILSLPRLRRAPGWLPDLAVAAAAVVGGACFYADFRVEKPINDAADRDTAFVESIVAGDRGLLVSPWWLTLDYVNKHPGVPWSFVPENRETWDLLDRRYPIGTVILPAGPPAVSFDGMAARLGLTPAGERTYRGVPFEVYRRPRADAAARGRAGPE